MRCCSSATPLDTTAHMPHLSLKQLVAACAVTFSLQAHADSALFTGYARGSESVDFRLTASDLTTVLAQGSTSAGGFLMSLNGGPSFDGLLRRPVPAHLVRHALHRVHRAGNVARLRQQPRLRRPRPALRQRRHRRHQRQGSRVPDRGLGDRLRDDARRVLAEQRRGDVQRRQRRLARRADAGLELARAASAAAPAATSASIERPQHQDMIYAPVPEPETYMLMLAGLWPPSRSRGASASRPEDASAHASTRGEQKADFGPPFRVPGRRAFPHNRAPMPGGAHFHRARRFDWGEHGSRACSSRCSPAAVAAAFAARRRHAGHRRGAWRSSAATRRFPAGERARRSRCPTTGPQSRPGLRRQRLVPRRLSPRRSTGPEDLLALYIERACSNVQVHLNGALIFSGGRMVEPVTRNCSRPQLVTLPPALLRTGENVVDLRVVGHPLERVASRQAAAGLSRIEIGPPVDAARRPCRAPVLGRRAGSR